MVDKAKNKNAGQKQSAIPDHVKRPGDHQPAKEDVEGPKTYTITWPKDSDNSHDYLIEGERMDDVELLEYFTDDNFVGALRTILGPKQWATYKDLNRDPENGRVSAKDASGFLNYLLGELKRKNS